MPSNKGANNISESDVQGWGLDDVAGWLKSNKLESCVEEFRSLQIDGQRLLVCVYTCFCCISRFMPTCTCMYMYYSEVPFECAYFRKKLMYT